MINTESRSWVSAIFRFFRSVKLAIILILVIIITSIIATLIPQNENVSFYKTTYSRIVSWFILSTGYNNFFKSFLFIFPSSLFFVNLSVCTFDRMIGRLKRRVKKRYGPDILHFGLLILIIGGIVTFIGRQDAFVRLAVGDEVNLTGGYTLTLKKFDFLKYENGRPKDWISTVQLKKNDQIIKESFPIEVNSPLKAGNKKIYQSSYTVKNVLYISDPEGTIYQLDPGQIIPIGKEGMIFRDIIIDPSGTGNFIAIFDRWAGHEVKERLNLPVSSKIDIYTITEMDSKMTSGLLIVDDPGYYTVLIGLILLTIGLFLTYYQKLGDDKI